MRSAHVAVVLLVVLAGCSAPFALPGSDTPTPPDEPVTTPDRSPGERALHLDPDTDRIGWENGTWHDEPLDVTPEDGLNESELNAVVARAMARVEVVRGLEFNRSVPVTVINRSTFAADSSGDHSPALQRFDNAKFEAMFLVGEDRGSLDEQESNRNASVAGFYSPSRDAIVIVSDAESPRLEGEGTLAHELVHALQDQQFNLSDSDARTRSAVQGRNGLVEGDASYVEDRYLSRCGEGWDCIDAPASDDGGGGGGSVHFGVQFLMFYPYSDGPGFVEALYDRGGWAAVNDAYENPPEGVPEVTDADRYPGWEPTTVDLSDRSSADWQRVRPPNRPDHAVVGQSGVAAGLAYTLLDDHNESGVVDPRDAINYHSNGSVDRSDPFQYDMAAADGWAGGRMHVFENGPETAYVWRTEWDSEADAREFAEAWADVIGHWGGERRGDAWVVPDGPFADAFRVDRTGTTVTVVNAPTRDGLEAVHGA